MAKSLVKPIHKIVRSPPYRAGTLLMDIAGIFIGYKQNFMKRICSKKTTCKEVVFKKYRALIIFL